MNDTVSHILYGIAKEGKSKVIETLLVDIDKEMLVESRNCLFQHVTERYKEELQQADIQEVPDLYAKRRNGEKAAETLASDCVELYLYARRMVDIFSKAILGNAGKYIEFRRPSQQKKHR